MNQIEERTEQGLSYKSVGIAQAEGGGVLMPANFGEVVAFATMMARSQHAIPKHLRNNDGACMAVTMQALRWGLDPFAVAGKSYSVNDMVAYEAQLITAVVNTRSGIKGRLRYEYEGEGDSRRCTVTGILDGEEYSYTTPAFGAITPKNSPLWKTDPDQQLGYFAGKRWARRYTPEVILGVYDRDEVEEFRGPDNAKDVTPQPTVMQRLQARSAADQPAQEGFSHEHVRRQTESVLTGQVIDNSNYADEPSPSASSADDAVPPASSEPAGSSSLPAGSTNTNAEATSASGESQSSESSPAKSEPHVPGSPDQFRFDPNELTYLKEFVAKALKQAEDTTLGEAAKLFDLEGMDAGYRGGVISSPDGIAALDAALVAIKAVISGKRTRDQAASYIARDLLGCAASELEGRK